MAVHASSVISTTINTFDPLMYTAITDKEEYCYDSGTNGGLAEFQPQFQKLSDTIVAWMGNDREENLRDFIQFMYSYKVFADMYGTDSSLLAISHGDIVVGMDGYRLRIQSDSTTYYDDYPQVTFTSTTITRTSGSFITDGFADGMSVSIVGSASNDGSVTIDASGVSASVLTVTGSLVAEGPVANVSVTSGTTAIMGSAGMSSDMILINAAFAGQETDDMVALQAGYTTTVGGKGFELLFSNEPPLATLSKDDLATYIFTTLNYRTVFDNLNTGTLKSPPIFREFEINYDFTV